MKAASLGLVVLAAVALGASPALAKKHHASCSSIGAALSSGKTPEQVAKSLHTTQDRVRACSEMAQGSRAQGSAKGDAAQGSAK